MDAPPTGRTHRSNQVNAPNYVFLISQLSGEYRFASIVASDSEVAGLSETEITDCSADWADQHHQ